ncbi:replication initiation factor domain-containing protein [Geobacter sp. FeAm09]|uniref:replication initiation factor domain-containing protein n=1 Tax=Geobacter sp. FeAm09 TaxID=2597769 RepID=UPI0011EE9107|nr:replication initiation factor domain-containing protein [Geobacter sp. FeAm09]QEM67733.1 replication initiation factor domain-containing protein [Geobacter sp. FeAm09]
MLNEKKQDAMKANGVLDQNPHERQYIHLASGKPPNYRYHLQFPEYHLYLSITEKAEGSPNGYLSVNSEALWKYGLPYVLETLEIDLYHFGGIIERTQPSRVDMCVDYRIPDGLTLPFLETHRVSRAKETTFHLRHDVLETYYVGSPSAPVRLRIYDKDKEIHAKGTKFWFAEIWNTDDIAEVWRVEFQMRRPFLRQFGINSLEDLWQKIGGVWAYLTGEWISLRLPDNGRTARRSVLPWWEHVQQAGNQYDSAGGVRRYGQSDMLAPVEWYVSHVAGCLASVAARLNIDDCSEAVKVLGDNQEGHWRHRDFKSEVQKRSIRLGRISCDQEGGGL